MAGTAMFDHHQVHHRSKKLKVRSAETLKKGQEGPKAAAGLAMNEERLLFHNPFAQLDLKREHDTGTFTIYYFLSYPNYFKIVTVVAHVLVITVLILSESEGSFSRNQIFCSRLIGNLPNFAAG